MSKVFVFDFDICNGCHNCQVVCKDEHCDQAWLPYSEAQPMTGQFWMNLREKVRGQVPVVKISYHALFCNHCADAPCMKAGGDAVYRRDDGLVIIDPDKAKGKREIADACPIGAVYYNEELDIPQKCTGCAHLLDNGWEEPRCVDACPTGALRYVEESEVDLSEATTMSALEGCGPRVYMLHAPKRFIAGMVVDRTESEVVIGAKVDLVDKDGNHISTMETDEFGDFKFDQVPKGEYKVLFNSQEFPVDVTKEDRYIGVLDA